MTPLLLISGINFCLTLTWDLPGRLLCPEFRFIIASYVTMERIWAWI